MKSGETGSKEVKAAIARDIAVAINLLFASIAAGYDVDIDREVDGIKAQAGEHGITLADVLDGIGTDAEQARELFSRQAPPCRLLNGVLHREASPEGGAMRLNSIVG